MMYRLPYKVFRALIVAGSLLSLVACASDQVDLSKTAVVVEGNGKCHPASDLPAHKTMKKVPEVETTLGALYDLLLGERKDHAKDVQDYNSLYDICVNGKPVSK